MRLTLLTAIVVTIGFHAPRFTQAQHPFVGWRTDGTGRYEVTDPPVEWSEESGVLWKTPVPGRSHTAAIVIGPLVIATSDPAELLAIRLEDGRIAWQRSFTYADVFPAEKAEQIAADHIAAEQLKKELEPLKQELNLLTKAETPDREKISALEQKIEQVDHRVKNLQKYPPVKRGPNSNSTPTPASDGKHIFAGFGTGIVAACTLDGEILWTTWVEGPGSNFGHSASPVLVDGKVIVHYQDLVALDARTGKELWRTDVPAKWGTSLVAQIGGRNVLIHPSGAFVNPDDGSVHAKDLFNLGHNSPLMHNGVLFAMQPGKYKAIELPETTAGLGTAEVLWESRGTDQRTFASPAYFEGLIYSVTENGIMDVNDAETGKTVARKRLDFGNSRVYPSVTVAGGYVYVSNDSGVTLVFKPGRELEEVAENRIAEGFSGAPVFVGNRMVLRARGHVYCIGR